jgi:DNA-binding Lrp family transcriptional regulator
LRDCLGSRRTPAHLTELAARINLSVSPCHRRLRELERSGAIRGYRAIVDPAGICCSTCCGNCQC